MHYYKGKSLKMTIHLLFCLILPKWVPFTPLKTNMEGPKIAVFERRYIFQTIIFGIYVRFRGCNDPCYFCFVFLFSVGEYFPLSLGGGEDVTVARPLESIHMDSSRKQSRHFLYMGVSKNRGFYTKS